MRDDWDDPFFNRRPPWEWEDLGVNVTGATSAEEALKKAGLDWEVAVERVFVEHGGKALESRYMATVRIDAGAVLGIVSESMCRCKIKRHSSGPILCWGNNPSRSSTLAKLMVGASSGFLQNCRSQNSFSVATWRAISFLSTGMMGAVLLGSA